MKKQEQSNILEILILVDVILMLGRYGIVLIMILIGLFGLMKQMVMVLSIG